MCYIAMEAMAILDLSLLKMVIFHNSYDLSLLKMVIFHNSYVTLCYSVSLPEGNMI